MIKIVKVMGIVQREKLPFYVEHNDFMSGTLTVTEEVADLMSREMLAASEAEECIHSNSVWSARYYFEAGTAYHIEYAATFEKVIEKILEALESMYGK